MLRLKDTLFKRLLLSFLLFSLIFPQGIAANGSIPIIINLQQLNELQPASLEATGYLKKLIEQRTDNRIEVHLYGSGQKVIAVPQMTVTDIPLQPGTDLMLLNQDCGGGYQLLIDKPFWQQLSAELKIILRGTIADTLTYLAELGSLQQ